MTEVRLQITLNMRQAPSSSVCLPHTHTHATRRCACTLKQKLNTRQECMHAHLHTCRSEVHAAASARGTRRRLSAADFTCNARNPKHIHRHKRRSVSPGGVGTGRHPSTELQQSSRLSLPHCQHAFPFTHKHSPLLFLSPLQSSIILSPHRHCRQWDVEWGRVKLICGHVLCYCFNKIPYEHDNYISTTKRLLAKPQSSCLP